MSPWTARVAELRDLASEALSRDDLDEALARVGEAFAIVDAEGNQQHEVFASLLCVAADVAIVSDEVDSARSLYMRAHQVAAATQADGAVLAKALVGLGSIYEIANEPARAAEHYRTALAALADSGHADAELGRAAIAEALANLERAGT